MRMVGVEWQFSGVGNFSSRGTSDMLLRNSNTGALEVYDITSNQVTSTAFIGTVEAEWQFTGVGNFCGLPEKPIYCCATPTLAACRSTTSAIIKSPAPLSSARWDWIGSTPVFPHSRAWRLRSRVVQRQNRRPRSGMDAADAGAGSGNGVSRATSREVGTPAPLRVGVNGHQINLAKHLLAGATRVDAPDSGDIRDIHATPLLPPPNAAIIAAEGESHSPRGRCQFTPPRWGSITRF
jgi:hypothetical protein